MHRPIRHRVLTLASLPAALGPAVLLAAVLLAMTGCGRKEASQGAMTADRPAPAMEPAPGEAQASGEARVATQAQATGEAQASGEAQAATQSPTAAARQPAPDRTRTVVNVLRLQEQAFTLSATYIGHLLPRERVEMRSELDGVVERVQFDDGEPVQAGQLLANISTAQLRVRRDQARADLALASSTYERERSLHANKLLTDAQVEQSRTRRELAEYTLRLAEIELEKSSVNAPIAGTVKTRAVSRGEFVNKGQLIAEILDIGTVRALFNVPEREMRYLRPGRRVEVTLEALPGETFAGVVRLVGLEADLKTRTFPVEVEVDNAQARLRPGMLARVNVALERYEKQLLVPRYAILERENGRIVYVAQDGKAQERRIEIGASADGQVQVLKGLLPGELLIVVGQQKLTPGEPVQTLDANP